MASRALKNRPSTKRKTKLPGLLAVFTISTALLVSLFVGVTSIGSTWFDDLPDYEDTSYFETAQKTTVYANDGVTILAEFYIENREPITLEAMSPYVLECTIATEDERFYEHDGVDLWAIARAAVVNFTGGAREGASTITQQFVRQTILAEEANDITIRRKAREMYIAREIEKTYSKDDILSMYLNTINFGSGAYGIEAAAQRYFSKSALDLSLVEAATLVGIPQSPTLNNPIDNPENCLNRRNLVLLRMFENEYISEDEYNEAVEEPLVLELQDLGLHGIYLYPYFTSYIRQELINQFSVSEVFKGGMSVYTTIDPYAQSLAEETARVSVRQQWTEMLQLL